MPGFPTVRVAAIQATPVIRLGSRWDELWERLWANSVDIPGPHVDGLVAVCRERDLFCAIGVNERESDRPGTL